ncbi:hypothetical protein IM40_03985 [Candidatus Paracaedimonas acanthamoebae]|nr:hypothetical protein IM40_03985 [Candidatus Paracaedimonas acanthamoebae]
MYIDIALVNKDRRLIESITKENNTSYLVKGENNPVFPYLGEVEIDDYSVFFDKDMDAIIEELLRVRKEVADPGDQTHIDDIIRLAKKCKEMPETALVFSGV